MDVIEYQAFLRWIGTLQQRREKRAAAGQAGMFSELAAFQLTDDDLYDVLVARFQERQAKSRRQR